MTEPLNPFKGTDTIEDPTEHESDDAAMADRWTKLFARAEITEEIEKAFSPAFGSRSKRRAQLVARLKSSRGYDAPVRGGTGKQFRSKRRTFISKHGDSHDERSHGNWADKIAAKMDELRNLARQEPFDIEAYAEIDRQIQDLRAKQGQAELAQTPQPTQGQPDLNPGEAPAKEVASQGRERKLGIVRDRTPTPESVLDSEVDDTALAESIFDADLELPDGDRYGTRVIDAWSTNSGLHLTGKVYTSAGREIGSFARQIKGTTVYNASFEIHPEFRGRGIGTMFLSHWEDQLSAAGVTEMSLSAADVGRYAWAVAGYEFSNSFSMGRINKRLGRVLEEKGDVIKATSPKVWSEATDLHESINNGYNAQPIDFALIGSGEPDPLYGFSHFGKGFMIRSSNGWTGTKKLQLAKSLDTAREVWKRWASEDPAAVEADDPEFLAEIRAAYKDEE